MLELLQTVWGFVLELLTLGWELGVLVVTFAGGVLHHLHADAPRLEGLLVGVLLAWLLLRRDKHPLLRVLSSPLKLVVDVLDLAWNQVVEIAKDVWGVGVAWVCGVFGWCKQKVVGVWSGMMDGLRGLKEKLSK